jgi:hypothetical protein
MPPDLKALSAPRRRPDGHGVLARTNRLRELRLARKAALRAAKAAVKAKPGVRLSK